ncbi:MULTISPECIES: YihY/virulence factor BrkB family protein [unclassified Salinibacterium]|uniref:YihY/virulence factor BrkB family protein n=1 Tax=unclassified Salinibacterium TaxID=2632331 RepID=UPI001AB0293F|nr:MULTISPECIES: YihY/virulence factor BrkB family protein [unclassified Salinibacterium]
MAEQTEQASERAATAPHPDDPRKPDSLTEITKPSWGYVLKKTLREFGRDQCIDIAASLTYYAVLAIFPALLAIVSLLGIFGQAEATTGALLELLGGLVPADTIDTIRGPIEDLIRTPGAGLAFVVGIVGAIWSASGFVGAFSRAMNRMYSIEEGRTFLQLRPMQLLVTIITLVLLTIAAVLLVLSGPIAQALGAFFGLGEEALLVWNIAKWPVVIVIGVIVVALLYYAAPNIKQPKFRWISVGAVFALVVWGLASFGFGFYVSNFGNYGNTYGSLAGVIIFLLWIWISNLALLFGAELDSELERGRQLQAGIHAEETVQLPPRGTKKSDKAAEQRAADVLAGLELRDAHQRGRRNPHSDDR